MKLVHTNGWLAKLFKRNVLDVNILINVCESNRVYDKNISDQCVREKVKCEFHMSY